MTMQSVADERPVFYTGGMNAHRKPLSWQVNDKYVVARKDGTVKRKCVFCGDLVSEEDGKDIKFIVHLGSRTSKHSKNKDWEAYIKRVNPF